MNGRHILEVKKTQIETNLDSLFDEVVTALDKALNCTVELDVSVCEALINHDVALNEKRRMLEQDCLVAIASQQPVASDLRDLIASMRIASELERMGDYASDIADVALKIERDSMESSWLEPIQRMAALSQEMSRLAMQAHKMRDVDMANKVGAKDDELDALMVRLVNQLMDVMGHDSAHAENASRMLWIAHNLERYGDRATNIAEQVIFQVEGRMVDLD